MAAMITNHPQMLAHMRACHPRQVFQHIFLLIQATWLAFRAQSLLRVPMADAIGILCRSKGLPETVPPRLAERVTVLFSPVLSRLSPADLAAWILTDRLPVRIQVQLHKIIWPDMERGV